MYDYYFTFPTLTASQQAMMYLRTVGIVTDPVKVPLTASSGGCANGLGVGATRAASAAAALRRANLSPSKIFRRDNGAMLREVWL